MIATLVEVIPEAVLLRDCVGAVIYANPAYQQRFMVPAGRLTDEQEALNAAAEMDLLENGGNERKHADIWQTVTGPITVHVARFRIAIDGKPVIATVVGDIGTHHGDSELLKRVLLQSRCILWQASVTEVPRTRPTTEDHPIYDIDRDTVLHWVVRIVAPEVVATWLPVDAPDGRALHLALYHNRPLADRVRNIHHAIQALHSGASGYQQDFRMLLDSGETVWLAETVTIERVSGSEWRLVGVCTDITERRQIEARLAHHAQHDPLTGLANRQHLLDKLDQIRLEGRSHPGLLHLELSQFKRLNDSLGHEFGDRVLSTVADRLRRAVGQRGTVARLSSAEFAVLLTDTPDSRTVQQFADRLLGAMQMPLTVEDRTLTLSCAIGCARAENSHDTELLRAATIALEKARAQGTDAAVLFDASLSPKVATRFETEEALRRALHSGEIQPYYQPIVSLASGETIGFEALARWTQSDAPPVAPSHFIPVAEESGLIVPLGAIMLRAACRDFMRWKQAHPHLPLTLSVNVSERQFRQPYFVLQIQEALRETGFPAQSLNLELTESILLVDVDECLEKLRHLNSLGIRLTLDDFGTGYSSLSYLSRLPASALKIDHSFVHSLTATDPTTVLHNEAIVRTIIALARTLQLQVTAEGIETPEQRLRLRALGADHGQGYFFSRPLSASAADGYLTGYLGSTGQRPAA